MKYKKDNNGIGPQIAVWTTIQKWNVHDLINITHFARDLGVDVHIFHPVIINQCNMQQTDNSTKSPLWVTPEQLPLLREQVAKLIEYEKKEKFIAFIHDPKLFVTYFEGRHSRKAWKCNPFQFLNIGPDGKTQVCGDSFGNIHETTISEAYFSEKAAEHRGLMKKCRLNCLQTCWSRLESDRLKEIIDTFLSDLDEKQRLTREEKIKIMDEGKKELARYERLILEISRSGNTAFESPKKMTEVKIFNN